MSCGITGIRRKLTWAAVAFGAFVAGLLLYVAWPRPALFAVILVLLALSLFTLARARDGRREGQASDFPEAWRSFLLEQVAYYRRLDEAGRRRFEGRVLRFLRRVRVTGVELEINDEVRLLVAASAVIPALGFPDWDYPNLEEVLLYPDTFDEDYRVTGRGGDLVGLVGDEELSRVVILSWPDLRSGFRRSLHLPHPGFHEFAHLIDGADGAIDGVPGLSGPEADRWENLLAETIDAIVSGRSRMDPYAAEDFVECFAVATEYFFQRPEILATDHPRLYREMSRVFRQDPLSMAPAYQPDPRRSAQSVFPRKKRKL
jgi:Mlc titration factor MtfA (ptsG expression regulator)